MRKNLTIHWAVILLTTCNGAAAQTNVASASLASTSMNAALFNPASPSYINMPGKFSSPGVHFVTRDDFKFTDANGRMWVAPKGTITDGASIPQFAMSIVGAPTNATYMNAAIIHDAYCAEDNIKGASYHKAEWRDVHRMFYDALLASGADEMVSKTMYAAVWLFGPRKWAIMGKERKDVPILDNKTADNRDADGTVTIKISQTNLDAFENMQLDVSKTSQELKTAQLEALKAVIRTENPTFLELNALLYESAKKLHSGQVYAIPSRSQR